MPSICLETEVDGCMGCGVIRSSVLIILNMHVQLIKQSIKSYKRHKYIHVLWFMYYLLSTVVLSQINQQKVKVTALGAVKVKNRIK